MKNFIIALVSIASVALAANVQVLTPTGADFAPDAPSMVQSIVRSAVAETGNTPVSKGAEIELKTSLMTMGSSIVVVCEAISDGEVVGSGKQKAASLDDLDFAIEQAVKKTLGSDSYASTATEQSNNYYVVVTDNNPRKHAKDPNDNFAHKRPTRNYKSYGLGAAMWHDYDFEDYKKTWDAAFLFHAGWIFEVTPQGAITIINNLNMSMGGYWQLHETFLIGGRFFLTSGGLSPFLGAGLGLGVQFDEYYENAAESFAIGLASGIEAGIVFFRNSSVQLEVGVSWDALWDGFDSFDRRFGAGSFYVAVNY